jgi:ABC-type Zn uptake system ZnuABC Zn-binding protein ZnuA
MLRKILLWIWLVCGLVAGSPAAGAEKIQVVTTLTDYAWIARYIGGDKVEVFAIVGGNQDAHYVRPKPSFAARLRKADLFVTTGLDLELWVPALLDMANNPQIFSGEPGYVAAAEGIQLLDKPAVLSRSQGGLHIYGNPHIHTNPLNLKIIADNIATGLTNVAPQWAGYFSENCSRFKQAIDRSVFGDTLITLLGSSVLTRLALSGNLFAFLETQEYGGRKLIDYLGGWLKKGLILRGKKIVTYHKNWVYFERLFGLIEIGNVEPKPGIPPSPRHVEQLLSDMKKHNVKVILSTNYFDTQKVRQIAARAGAIAVIVPFHVEGEPEVHSVFDLYDVWISRLTEAFRQPSAMTQSVPTREK